jgi:glycolate oxidase
VGGCVPLQGGIALSLKRMNRILEINTADGVVITQPAVITGVLQKQVKDLGWYYPPDPASLNECSIGGNIATNAGGPRCLKYGVTKHYVLGLEVVLADGSILRTGGRCHKNKTGIDLIGIFVGSEGLLGIVTEATLRIIPHPPQRGILSCSFHDFTSAAQAVQAILAHGILPSAMEIIDAFTLNAARNYLGTEQVPSGDAHLIVEIDGQQQSVAGELQELHDWLIDSQKPIHIENYLGETACEKVWQMRREFSYSLRNTGLTKLNEDIVVPRSRLVDLIQFAQKLQKETGLPIACFGHAGDGNIHFNIMAPDYNTPSALDQVFKQVLAWGGAITGEHGVGIAKKRWWSDAVSPIANQVMLDIKKALDPTKLLNPGKFLG